MINDKYFCSNKTNLDMLSAIKHIESEGKNITKIFATRSVLLITGFDLSSQGKRALKKFIGKFSGYIIEEKQLPIPIIYQIVLSDAQVVEGVAGFED